MFSSGQSAGSSDSKAESTFAQKAYPDLSHVKQSCYPPIAPKEAVTRANVECKLPVISQTEDSDSEPNPPALA